MRQTVAFHPRGHYESPTSTGFSEHTCRSLWWKTTRIGLADEIGTGLAQLEGLDVISRTSARQYAGSDKTIRQMGEELGVAYVLEGSVRYAPGEQIRITPQLVRVADETRLWSDTYDRVLKPEDVFDIQERIAREVSERLGLALLHSAGSSDRRIPTNNMEAYNAYLRGVEREGGGEDMEEVALSERMYQLATELDPDFALAWAQLGFIRSFLFFQGDRTAERRASAKTAVEKAVDLAPDLPETHRALGAYYSVVTLELDKAYAEWELARHGQPKDSILLNFMAFNRQQQGNWDKGVELRERMLRLDPRSALALSEFAWTRGDLRQYEEAGRLSQRWIALEPDQDRAYIQRAFYLALWKGYAAVDGMDLPTRGFEVWHAHVARALGRYDEALRLIDEMASDVDATLDSFLPQSLLRAWVYRDMGKPQLARTEYEKARSVVEAAIGTMPEDDRVNSAAGLIYAGLGMKDKALHHGHRGRELLMPPTRNNVQGPPRLWDLAMIQAQVGEPDAALDSLEEVLTIPAASSVHSVEAEGAFDSLRELPRYHELIERFSADVFQPPAP